MSITNTLNDQPTTGTELVLTAPRMAMVRPAGSSGTGNDETLLDWIAWYLPELLAAVLGMAVALLTGWDWPLAVSVVAITAVALREAREAREARAAWLAREAVGDTEGTEGTEGTDPAESEYCPVVRHG